MERARWSKTRKEGKEKMSRILIGKSKTDTISVDVRLLRRTRMLVTANSGGGKSWLLRVLAEQLFGKVPVWIIDPEGEFASLREIFGYVLVGKGGETPADVRSASLVAEKLRELRASAIFDLYDLKPSARHAWVRAFLEALMNQPKHLWKPMVLMLDEAQMFAPEKGMGESEAFAAVQDVATRGRKRRICLVAFTQRLAKISKTVTAELLNRLVGMTREGIDIDSALGVLSVARDEREEFRVEVKKRKPGEFYALGPAISNDRVLFTVRGVKTSHPDDDEEIPAEPPPAPEKVKALLPKLADLPKAAEERAKTEGELRTEIRSLKAQLAARPEKAAAAAPAPRTKPEIREVTKTVRETVEIPVLGYHAERSLKSSISYLGKEVTRIEAVAKRLNESIEKVKAAPVSQKISKGKEPGPVFLPPRRIPRDVRSGGGDAPEGNGTPLLAGERKMLDVLADFYPGSRTRAQLAQLAGYTMSGGTFANYFGTLRRAGYIKETNGVITLTEEGIAFLGPKIALEPKSSEEVIEMWRGKLLAGERKMFNCLLEAYPKGMSKVELGDLTGYTSTGGTFANYLGTLRRNDLAHVEDNEVRASDSLFEPVPA